VPHFFEGVFCAMPLVQFYFSPQKRYLPSWSASSSSHGGAVIISKVWVLSGSSFVLEFRTRLIRFPYETFFVIPPPLPLGNYVPGINNEA